MIPSTNRPESSLEDTASLWAARLEGAALSSEQRTRLDSWLAADPRHREALARYCQLSTDLERLLPALISSGSVTLPASSPVAAQRTLRRSATWGWIAAGTMTAAALVLILQPRDPPSALSNSYATPVAQRLAITLDDGTHVDLNAGTNLVIAHTDHERRVRLADGQAFFKVTKDASRPFIVETPAGSVRVTGTAFDVRTTSADEIEVTVLEGSVQVRLGQNNDPRHAGPIALGASDQLTSRREAAPTVQHLDEHAVSDALAWIDGQVVFSNTPLEQVLERFAHYHGRGISADAGARALRLSGRYALENLDSFFADLEAVLAVQVTHDQSGTTRVSLRN